MPCNNPMLIYGEIKKIAKETKSSPATPAESQGIVETEIRDETVSRRKG